MGDWGPKVGEWYELIGEDIQLKVTEAGEGDIPNVGELVRCKYVGRLVKTGEVFEVATDTGYRIGDNDTTPALELGLRHMRKGEKGLIRGTSKYAFGPLGRKIVGFGGQVEVPPDADIEYEVEVTDVYPAFNPKEAPTQSRLTEASIKKQLGNGFFHHEDWNRAIRCYQSAVKSLDPAEVDEEEEGPEAMREVIKMYCDISNNLAMALMKLERYKEACEVCVKVIELDPNNVKALYRGGVASMEQNKYEEADLALKEAYKLAPKDANIIKALKELARLKSEYAAKEKKMYQKMSGFLNKPRKDGEDYQPAAEGGGKDAEEEEEEEEGEGDGEDGEEEEEGEEMGEEEEEVEEDYEDAEEQPAAAGGTIKEKGFKGLNQQQAATVGTWLQYDMIATAVFLLLPIIYLWPDLMATWRQRLMGSPPESSTEL